MPNYSNTIIYKIINDDYPELIYVGSTTNYKKREQQHKERCYEQSLKSHYKLYETIRNHGGWDSWKMVKISDYPCEYNIDARIEEDRNIILLNANLNMKRAERSKSQYIVDTKEVKRNYDKERRKTKIICECGSQVSLAHISEHKKTPKHINRLLLS